MKLKLTVTLIGLLMIGMLLINAVLLFFWKHDALQREAKHDQAVLAHISSLLIQERGRGGHLSLQKFSFSEFFGSTEKGRLFILLRTEIPVQQNDGADDNITALLSDAAVEAENSGTSVSRTAASFSHGLFCNDLLVNARPLQQQGEIIGAVAVVRSLDALSQTLWKKEKTILVYLFVNVLVLGAIGFFRMVGLIIRPVERLVALANQYSDQDSFYFVTEDTGSEFGRLSNSLNKMLAKIEEDRQTVQQTITALEHANHALKKQQQEMIRAEKLATVGRMAAGLAHEIGNPLSVIRGYLGILLGSKKLDEEHKDFLCRSEQEVQRISTLIRQLLDFSRTGKGNPSVFSLHEVLNSGLEMIRMQAVFRNITVDTYFFAQKDQLYADSEHLRQVVVNCLLNSADAIHMAKQENRAMRREGNISVSTVLQEKQGLAQLVLCISDNGRGISRENLPVVFDPFYTSKEPGKGTGLGLSVSRSLVEAAGGTMEVQSTVGQGTDLLITLPLASSPDEETNDHEC